MDFDERVDFGEPANVTVEHHIDIIERRLCDLDPFYCRHYGGNGDRTPEEVGKLDQVYTYLALREIFIQIQEIRELLGQKEE